jgi:hypothetical protein
MTWCAVGWKNSLVGSSYIVLYDFILTKLFFENFVIHSLAMFAESQVLYEVNPTQGSGRTRYPTSGWGIWALAAQALYETVIYGRWQRRPSIWDGHTYAYRRKTSSESLLSLVLSNSLAKYARVLLVATMKCNIMIFFYFYCTQWFLHIC